MANNAVVPDKTAILNVVKQMRVEQEVEKGGRIDRKDEALYELAQMSGWKVLREYLERRIEHLSNLEDQKINEMSLAEIGMRHLMVSQILAELKNVIKKVERSSKFVTEDVDEQNASTVKR